MDKRSELLNFARNALQTSGVNGFSFRDLAAQAGIKSSSVHYYFRNKTQLFESLAQAYRIEFLQALDVIEAGGEPLEQRLEAFFHLFEKVLERDKFCLCGMLASDRGHLEASVISELGRYFGQVEAWLARQFEQQRGALPPLTLARATMAAMEGALLIDRAIEQREHLDAAKQLINSAIR